MSTGLYLRITSSCHLLTTKHVMYAAAAVMSVTSCFRM